MRMEPEVRFKETDRVDLICCVRTWDFFPEGGKEMLKGFIPFFI